MITVQSRERFLFELAQNLPEKCRAVELGVLNGEFSKMILGIVKPECLILVDPYKKGDKKYSGTLDYLPTEYSTEDQYQNLIQRFSTEIIIGQVIVVRKTSFEAVEHETDGYYDFVYHDASHLYDDIKRDIYEWLLKLKPTGIICGHDLIDFGGFGVKQAVHEFIEEHNFEIIIYNEQGGDFALKRKEI